MELQRELAKTRTGLRLGGPPRARLSGRGDLFLPILGTLYALGVLGFVFVWLVDPYDLRSVGASVRFAGTTYADSAVPKLVSVAAHDGTDLVVVGGSTSMAITPAMLREAFPEAARPVNLSFVSIRADQLAIVLKRLETSRTLKRIIINVEFTFNRDIEWIPRVTETRYYANAWHDPVPEFGSEAIWMAVEVLKTGVLDNPAWRRRTPDLPDFMYDWPPLTKRPDAITKLAQATDESRAWVTGAPGISCQDVPILRKKLIPFLQRMTARGVAVDLLLPPYSLALYADWSLNYRGHWFPGKGNVYANLMGLKRCTVQAVEEMADVHVHGFDTDFSITRDLGRYYDSSHIWDLESYRAILRRMARGDTVLTAARWPQYEATLKKAIEEFRP